MQIVLILVTRPVKTVRSLAPGITITLFRVLVVTMCRSSLADIFKFQMLFRVIALIYVAVLANLSENFMPSSHPIRGQPRSQDLFLSQGRGRGNEVDQRQRRSDRVLLRAFSRA